jgi:hypothetical protein
MIYEPYMPTAADRERLRPGTSLWWWAWCAVLSWPALLLIEIAVAVAACCQRLDMYWGMGLFLGAVISQRLFVRIASRIVFPLELRQ